MSYALTVNEIEGVWRVYCNVCRDDMGTMTIETLKAALAFAVDRGGVMCPSCRSRRCRRCGIQPRLEIPESGLCIFCEWESSAGFVLETDKEQSCLVNQNSRNLCERE